MEFMICLILWGIMMFTSFGFSVAYWVRSKKPNGGHVYAMTASFVIVVGFIILAVGIVLS